MLNVHKMERKIWGMNKNVGKFSYQHPIPPQNWPPSYRTLVFHAHILYIGNCIFQSGMWITHIYTIFYRKLFNHDIKIPRTETVPMREMLENVRWGKNELKIQMVWVNAILSKIRTFSIALLHWAISTSMYMQFMGGWWT